MTDRPVRNAPLPTEAMDPRVREAVRILENEQTPIPETLALATRVGLSQFHFVRLFTAQVGESPQDYARSVVLEHAAGRLRYTDDLIAAVARDFGYAKQATFTKAFTRRYGVAPGRWRAAAKAARLEASGEGVRLERLAPLHCLARRYLGPRRLSPEQWSDFLARLPEAYRGCRRIGLGYDDPSITPPERIRYDCAVILRPDAVMPEGLADQGFELLDTPKGLWASADVTGLAGVAQGYRRILAGWLPQNPGYTLEGDPFLECLAGAFDARARDLQLTVCLRVRKLEQPASSNMQLPGKRLSSPERTV